MSVARSVRVDGDKLLIEDDDGNEWRYAQGTQAPDDATIQIDCSWLPPGGLPGLVPGPDGKPLLRQAAKGLPQTAIAYLVGSLSTAMGDPLKAGWPGPGRYEFNQVP